MSYHKTDKAKRLRNNTEWIIAIGEHHGILCGKDWVTVQTLLLQNKAKAFRKVRSSISLLSGLIHCSRYGSFMRPKIHNKPNQEGKITFSYMCEMKEKSRKRICDIKNAPGIQLDQMILDKIKELSQRASSFYQHFDSDKITIQKEQNTLAQNISSLENVIKNNAESIQNLVASLAHGQGKNATACDYILHQINSLDKQNAEAKENLLRLKEQEEQNITKEQSLDFMKQTLSSFASNIDNLDIEAKRGFLKSIIDSIQFLGRNTRKKA